MPATTRDTVKSVPAHATGTDSFGENMTSSAANDTDEIGVVVVIMVRTIDYTLKIERYANANPTKVIVPVNFAGGRDGRVADGDCGVSYGIE